MKKELTTREQAAIVLHVVEDFNDWHELFKIAEGDERYNKMNYNSQKTTVAKWKNSDRIQNAIRDYKYKVRIQEEEKKKKYIEDWQREATEGTKPGTTSQDINFLNPEEFLQFANLQANNLKDEKDRRAYLEMIAKLMNYKDSEGETEQIKAYLPIICQDCDLYKRCEACTLSVCPVKL
jgi:hypothetical protein